MGLFEVLSFDLLVYTHFVPNNCDLNGLVALSGLRVNPYNAELIL